MKHRYILFLLVAFTLVSCDIDIDLSVPDDPYDDYLGRMIERVRIEHSQYESDYIYYDYDRRGRITSIEDTYYGTIHSYAYDENRYGDDVIRVKSNIGDDRDILLDWDGFAESEYSYVEGVEAQSIEYNYVSDMLWSIDVEEYCDDGSIFSEESYDFDYDYNDNLCSVERYYTEDDYYIDSELQFSAFSTYENNYNVDILSILGLYIDDDFASHIGRTGERSKYLPTRAKLRVKRNGRYDEDVDFRITYVGGNGVVSAIEVSTSLGMSKIYYISYL